MQTFSHRSGAAKLTRAMTANVPLNFFWHFQTGPKTTHQIVQLPSLLVKAQGGSS